MKQLLYILLLLPAMALAQSTNQNYVKKVVYKQPVTTAIATPTAAQANVSVTYFDGLGRPTQQVAHRQSATGMDIVTPIAYDKFGRQALDYLPHAAQTATMAYDASAVSKVQAFYYTATYENTTNPYSEKRMEASPLNRILEQGAPGLAWAVDTLSDNDHTIKFEYKSNAANQVRMLKATATWDSIRQVYNIAAVNSGYHPANTLYRTITKDENWVPGSLNHTTEEFKNKQGQVVLKRTYNMIGSVVTAHDTYYLYDQFGNLAYVLPPLANGSTTATTIANLCYQYKYDSRNRLVEKRVPGKQWEFIVYDKLDRVVATGPAKSPFTNLDTQGWLVTRYDAFGRAVLTGWYQAPTYNSTIRKALQDTYNGAVINLTRGTSNIDNIATGYAATSLPSGFKLLTLNYFDDYAFPGAPAAFSVMLDGLERVYYNNSNNKKPKGLPTGLWVRVLTTTASTAGETSHTLYDEKARPVRSHTANYLGGYTRTDTRLDFAGKVLHSTTYHKREQSSDELVAREEFAYTDQDRLLTHTHRVTFQGITKPVELIAKNEYDALGQLKNKRVGGPSATPTGLQKVDYTYNIRGWLKGINDIAGLAQQGDPSDLFAFMLNYDTVQYGVGGAVRPLYNGNISETFWKTSSDNTLRKYGYSYDHMNRLTEAIYQKPILGSPHPSQVTDSYNETIVYDKNGNISGLSRNGYLDASGGNIYQIDQLQYQYSYNQLVNVIDHSNSIDGFRDGQSPDGPGGTDYTYDLNGNMTSDWNKGIDQITYNHLNLPKRINFKVDSGDKFIAYIYNALGQKVAKQVIHQSATELVNSNTDYLGGYQYLKGVLQYFPTAEGYVSVTDGKAFDYVYNYMDHLGNIRLSYSKPNGGTIGTLEENHYYPFGMKHMNYGSERNNYERDESGGTYAVLRPVERNKYQYKYNGKEYQDELSLNWYDYQARNYDPAIGRWMNIDPKAEISRRWSPYTYCYNNPMRFIDPDGMKADDWRNKDNKQVYDAKKQEYTKYATAQDKKFGDALRNSGAEGAKQFDALTKSEAKIKVDFQEGTGVLPTQMGHTEINSFGKDDKGSVFLKEATIEIYLGSVSITKDMIMSGEMNSKDYQLNGLRQDGVDIIKNNDVSEFEMAVSTFGHEIGHTDQSNVATKVAADERGGKEEPGLDTELLPTKTGNTILRDLTK